MRRSASVSVYEYVCKLDIEAAKLLKLNLRFGGYMEGELSLPAVVYRANSRWYVEFSRGAAAIKA